MEAGLVKYAQYFFHLLRILDAPTKPSMEGN
jgi:hypothetical protein